MRARKEDFQSEYCIGSPLKMVGSGTGKRLILTESAIAAMIAAVLYSNWKELFQYDELNFSLNFEI